jgi:hypothetical protein
LRKHAEKKSPHHRPWSVDRDKIDAQTAGFDPPMWSIRAENSPAGKHRMHWRGHHKQHLRIDSACTGNFFLYRMEWTVGNQVTTWGTSHVLRVGIPSPMSCHVAPSRELKEPSGYRYFMNIFISIERSYMKGWAEPSWRIK